MLPDLRLLIPATVATFFLAAALGLFASLRIAQEPPYARTDQIAAADDTPIARISAGWPFPDPDRAAALRDLARVVKLEPGKNPVASDAIPAAAEMPSENAPQAAIVPPAPAEATVPQPETVTEGQRLASRPEAALDEEKPAQVAPAEIVKPRAAKPRVAAKKRPRMARRASNDPFAHLPRPGFESPSNFSTYGRHNQPR